MLLTIDAVLEDFFSRTGRTCIDNVLLWLVSSRPLEESLLTRATVLSLLTMGSIEDTFLTLDLLRNIGAVGRIVMFRSLRP